jgi:hypothetical protein
VELVEPFEVDGVDVLPVSDLVAAVLLSVPPEPSPVEPPPSPEVEGELELSDFESVVPLSFERAAARELEPRSFFAQPLPLKWTDGAEKTFVIVPSAPHSGQKFGPSAAIPWTTSVRRWQAEQT